MLHHGIECAPPGFYDHLEQDFLAPEIMIYKPVGNPCPPCNVCHPGIGITPFPEDFQGCIDDHPLLDIFPHTLTL